MAEISATIAVDAGEAIGALNDFADATESAAAKWSAFEDKLASGMDVGAAGGAGADKFAASWDSAASTVGASIDKIAASLGKLDGFGTAAGMGGPDKLVASWSGAADDIKASIDSITGSAGKLDDIGASADTAAAGAGRLGDSLKGLADGMDGVGGSAAPAADGIKGIGTGSDEAAAQVAALRAEMAALNDQTDAMLAKSSAVSDRAAVSAASTASLNEKVASSGYLATSSVEQDAGVAQAAQLRKASEAQAAADAEAGSAKYEMLGLAGLAAAGYGVDQAAKLQTGTTRLYTSAGESLKNLPMIEQGILKMAPETATSQANLLSGAYWVESAGYHGKSALDILKAVAEGSYAEGAPLSDVANATTSIMNAYGYKPGQAMSVEDMMLTAVGRGKMTMAQLSTALPNVLPVAHSAGLSLPEVLGSLATMTGQGVSADEASQEMRHTIGSLQNMSSVQTGEIQQLGGNPVELEKNLGKNGLLGTLTDINDLVTKNMGKSGEVIISTFNKSASAAADANKMMSAMPPSIKSVAEAYEKGSLTAKEFNAEVYSGSESAAQKNLLQQWATVENQSKGFSSLLKSGQPGVQTYEAALAKALGGQTGLQTFLNLEGIHLPVAQANTAAVAKAGTQGGDNIQGWKQVEDTLGFQLKSAETGLQSAATQIGKAFLPIAPGGLKDISKVASFFADHPDVTKDLALTTGGLAGIAGISKIMSGMQTAVGELGKLGQFLNIPGSGKLANMGQSTGLDGAATGLKGAAADLSEAAAKLSEGSGGVLPGEKSEGSAGEAAAEDETAAGALGLGALMKTGASGVLGGAMRGGVAAMILLPIADQADQYINQHVKNHTANTLARTGVDAAAGAGIGFETAGPIGAIAGAGIGAVIGLDPKGAPANASKAPGVAGGLYHQAAVMQEADANDASKVAIPKVDTSGLDETRADVVRDYAQIDHAFKIGKPPVLPAPDISALNSAKSKAGTTAQQVEADVENALKKVPHAAPPDLSAYVSAAGKAKSDGANISDGLAQGILAGQGTVNSAAATVASGAAHAMHIAVDAHSPSKVTEKLGGDLISGLILGMEGGQSALNTAASDAASSAVKPFTDATITGTISKLIKDAPSSDTGLTKLLKSDNTKLLGLAQQRQQIEGEITDAQQAAESAVSSASIMNAASYTPALANGPTSSYSLIQGMQEQESDLKAFASQIGQLQKDHLNSTLISQIEQSGVSSGLPVAEGITSGGAGTVSQLNKLESQIHASAGQLGTNSAASLYEAGQDAAKGFTQGLDSSLSSVDAAMRKMATEIVDTVKKELDSHSPSMKFAAIGMDVGAGFAQGIDASAHLATSAASRMASGMTGGFHYPSAGPMLRSGGGSGGGGAPAPNITVHVTVMGSVMTENELVSTVQRGLLGLGHQNWQTGIILPGRAG